MVQSIQISENTSLYDLRQTFGLQPDPDPQFFWEWQQELPELSNFEMGLLDRVKHNFESMTERSQLSENLVKMVAIAPILDLAGLYSMEYRIRDEASIAVSAEGEDAMLYRGKIDILVWQDQLWVITIETKNSQFSLNKATPQALAYMLGSPHPDRPVYGLVSNGSEFRFLKLSQQPTPHYGMSAIFSIFNPGNELYRVLQILKKIVIQVNE